MTSPSPTSYIGQELDLFAHAVRWKAYWSAQVRPFVAGDVLEVGAGLGANTGLLQTARVHSWRCLEPDPLLASQLAEAVEAIPVASVLTGTIAAVRSQRFDTILYIDVLEHIENDKAEAEAAASLLRPGGHLIVLAPAHQSLFTAFDRAIGHYRRYNRATLSACTPRRCTTCCLAYLDAVGLLASTANRVLLRQRYPTLGQVRFWDRYMVPASRLVDRMTRYRLGKSILAIWRRDAGSDPRCIGASE